MLHNNQEWIFSTENILQTQTSKRIHQVSICLKFSPNKGDFFFHQCMFVQCRYIVKQYHLIKSGKNLTCIQIATYLKFSSSQLSHLRYIERFFQKSNIDKCIYLGILNMPIFSNYKCFQKCATLCFQKSVTFVSIQKYKSNDRMTKN